VSIVPFSVPAYWLAGIPKVTLSLLLFEIEHHPSKQIFSRLFKVKKLKFKFKLFNGGNIIFYLQKMLQEFQILLDLMQKLAYHVCQI
jgi:hypothetical protein